MLTTKHASDLDLVAQEAEKFRLTKLLRKWQTLNSQKLTIETDRDHKLQPFRVRFDKDSAPILAAAENELAPIVAKLLDLKDEISLGLLILIKPDGTVPIAQLETPHAIAEVTTDKKREISPAEFFAAVPTADRHSNFWKCLRVLIGEANQFLAKETMLRLAKFNRTHGVTIRPK